MSLTPPPTWLSADGAIAKIKLLTGSNATIQGVIDVINMTNPFDPKITGPATTVGYAGILESSAGIIDDPAGILGNTPMYEIAQSYAAAHTDATIIDNTAIYDLLSREAFQAELRRIINEVNARNPDPNTQLTFSEVYEGKNAAGVRINNTGMWDVGSAHLMENAVGDVKVFAPFASPDSVLMKTEVIKLINTPGVTSINGVPIEEFRAAWSSGNTELMIMKVKASSLGEVATLTAEETGVLDGAAMLGNDARLLGLFHDIVHSNVGEVLSSPTLQRMGAAGAIIDFSRESYKAIEKYNAGDTAGAIHIMEEWTAKFAGIVGGSTVAMAGAEAVAAGVLTAMAAAGIIVVPGMVVTAFVVTAAIVGGYYGGELGKLLLEKGIELELYTQKMIDDFVHAARDWWTNLDHTIHDIGDTLSHAYDAFLHAVKVALQIDPLIVDLNGNGIALDTFQASNALFDLNGDGVKENTGWTKANSDDAFLVIDKNNDGKINDITEMFGSSTIPGFADLRNYDSNKDGVINASDTQFNLLKLWNDKNANGVVDAGELTTLAQNNITSISLSSYGSRAEIAGNLQTAISTVTKTDGTTRDIHEVSFAFETPTIMTNPDATLPASFQLNAATLLMPYSRGYGSAYSWQAAMSLDPTLLAMGQDMMKLTPSEFYKFNDMFQDFLFRWAGVEGATVASTYGNTSVYGDPTAEVLDPRKVAFMEKLTGKDFIYISIHSLEPAQQSWDLFYNYFLDKFLAQSTLHDVFPHAATIPALDAGSSAASTVANDNLLAKVNCLLTV